MIECILYHPDNIEIGQRRFYHDDISSLFYIQRHLTQRFIGIVRIHLVGGAVSKSWCRLSSLTEWPIETRRIFSRVCHDGDMFKAVFVKSITNCPYATVHH